MIVKLLEMITTEKIVIDREAVVVDKVNLIY